MFDYLSNSKIELVQISHNKNRVGELKTLK
jgi:hypothetical protein